MERTKKAIIEAFQQILEETPINKITVKSIVERCGINRNTFYYYFEGIPELVEYHLTAMADQLLDSFDQPNPTEELRLVVNYFMQRKRSVLHSYRYLPREQFLPFQSAGCNTVYRLPPHPHPAHSQPPHPSPGLPNPGIALLPTGGNTPWDVLA